MAEKKKRLSRKEIADEVIRIAKLKWEILKEDDDYKKEFKTLIEKHTIYRVFS